MSENVIGMLLAFLTTGVIVVVLRMIFDIKELRYDMEVLRVKTYHARVAYLKKKDEEKSSDTKSNGYSFSSK